MLSVAQIVEETEAEGPGRRFAIWVQGCPMRCPGCCNPQMLRFEGGEATDPEVLADRILKIEALEGVSFLGGEPFAQAEGLAKIAGRVRDAGLSVMVYTGFTLAELRDKNDVHVDALLAATDLLVDGRYERDKPDTTRRWIGSTNQGLHFLSDRYAKDDPRLTSSNTLEIRFNNGEVVVNGWPALAASLLTKRAYR